jgi:hypothetical protein
MWISKASFEALSTNAELESVRSIFGNPPKDFTGTYGEWVRGYLDRQVKETSTWRDKAYELLQRLNHRVDASINDPLFRQIRTLLPDELESMKNTAMSEISSNPNGPHSDCQKTLLLVMRTFVHVETLE